MEYRSSHTKYVYASLMAFVSIILLLGNNIVREGLDKVLAYGGNPITVSGANVQVTGGELHTCALRNDGTVMCWGYNGNGQSGDGTPGHKSIPVAVSGLSGVVSISAGGYHTCALKSDNTVMCWGDNTNGQLGDGTNVSKNTPTAVSGFTGVISSISAGREHTCALKTDNTVMCWGYNFNGQLGDGTNISKNTPTAVSGFTGVISSISVGGNYTCALKSDNTVMCWGYNFNGQLGDGTYTDSTAPVAVSGLTGVVMSISAGMYHTCALKSDNTVMCWGYNSNGQLGDGTTVSKNTPVAVSGFTGVISSISVGWLHTCALKNDNTVICWGYNNSGQLGNGSTGSTNSPGIVPGLSGVSSISAGGFRTCALKSDGTVMCWGSNSYSQLGDGTTVDKLVPVNVLTNVGGSFFNVFVSQGVSVPSAPLASAASNITASGITWNWQASATATYYNLFSGSAVIYSGSLLSSGETGLVASTLYTRSVVACNSGGCSAGTSLSGTTSASAVVVPVVVPPVVIPVITGPGGGGGGGGSASIVNMKNPIVPLPGTGTNTNTNPNNTTPLSSNTGATPIGSYIPSKNDSGVKDHRRLTPLPSDTVCVLDEHVKYSDIITSDIRGNWAEGYIRTLIRFWVIKNTDTFSPINFITRGEFLALMVRSLRCHYTVAELNAASTISWTDVPQSHFVNKYLAIAELNGWISTDASSRFRPDVFITRAEAMEIVSGATGLSDTVGAELFRDIGSLPSDIQDSILTGEKYSVIHGMERLANKYFYPKNPLTRAEAAKIIQRTFVR